METKVKRTHSIESISFYKKIKPEEEELFVLKYKALTKVIPGLVEDFSIDINLFKYLIAKNSQNANFCKFYLIQEHDAINFGMTFSNTKTFEVEKEDKLYVLNSKLFVESNLNDFNKFINNFNSGINSRLIQNINCETKMVYYDLEIVKNYIDTLELHFKIDNLKFNFIQYSDIDSNGNHLPNYEKINNKISFSVHANVKDIYNNTIVSIGYDFGTIYP
ncbi:conserved hypothetical protein [Flavobacterium sp. 9AF]|uniref:hypothetical protein n=1 Tax=Flavobacterium sp. 9AF TaxID=2653142 RepID=UPI0012F3DEE7|nr:hypothetical protein [Flavobacterium sp. 9AF]VXB85020.1 conserved hypothetical protein [Flavobacterium sp. 9AF]